MSRVPVLLTGFNRPDLLETTLISLSRYLEILEIYIHLDGPRTSQSRDLFEIEKCKEVVERILAGKSYQIKCQEINLGCKRGMEQAIFWFFENVEKGIIVEDDVVLNETAIYLAKSCLDYFESDHRIGSISLFNPAGRTSVGSLNTYLLSPIPQLWGWATWRNRWYQSDSQAQIDERKITHLMKLKFRLYYGFRNFKYWSRKFKRFENMPWDTWDVTLLAWFLTRNYRTVVFPYNLVQNIGFDSRATHTKNTNGEPSPFEPNLDAWRFENKSFDISSFKKQSFLKCCLYVRKLHTKIYLVPSLVINPNHYLSRVLNRIKHFFH